MKATRPLHTWVALMLGFSSAFAAPLDNWHWRNPLPNGNPLPSFTSTAKGVVFATGKFVAVGTAGVVSISTDGTNWVESATATTSNLNAIIYAAGQFVAVGDGGVVETSPDGASWALQNSGTVNSLSGLAYGNGKFVAVGDSAVIASPNAVSWTPAISGLSGAKQVAGSANGFVAVARQPQAYFSTDGLVWTSQTFTVPAEPTRGAYLQNAIVTYWNGVFVMGSSLFTVPYGVQAEMYMFTSADGHNWSTNDIGSDPSVYGFVYYFFLIGSNSLYAAGMANHAPFLQFSSDGTRWTQTNSIPYTPYYYPPSQTAGAYGNGTYVIFVPTDDVYPLPRVFTSTDSFTWTSHPYPFEQTPPVGPTNTFTSIAYNNGKYVVAAGNSVAISSNGSPYTSVSNAPALSSVIAFGNQFVGAGPGGTIYLSGDGLSWTQKNSATTSSLHGVVAGNGLLVAVGDNGAIQTSPTGTIWTSRASGTSLPLYSVIGSNGIFVAVGQKGTVLTSPDGINWAGQDSGQLKDLKSVTYGSAGFLAAGVGGTLLTSPNGTNWFAQYSGTSASFENVSFGNGHYLAIGSGSLLMTSDDGNHWISRSTGATGGQTFYGSVFANSRFEVVGANGTVLESDVIAPLFDVQIYSGGLKMFAPTGSSFRLQACTDLSVPDWTDVATFSNVAAITQWTNNSTGYKQRFYRLISP